MLDREAGPHAHDARHLTPRQWGVLRQSIIRQVHAERGRMIRAMIVGAAAAVHTTWRRLHQRRQALAALHAMSDYELRDIGVARSGIEAASSHKSDTPRQPKHNWRVMMSKAYWIVRVSVRDEANYPDYLAAAKPAFEKFGARFIVRGGAFEAMEGTARDRNVVVEFADRATATACYRSPEYEAAKAIRQKYADADFIIIEGA